MSAETLREAADYAAIDRLLALPHRDDNEPCSCDECMSYGAEDAGADWYRIPTPNRIVMRVLDGADSRLAVLRAAFDDHAAALRAALASAPVQTGTGEPAWLAQVEGRIAMVRRGLSGPGQDSTDAYMESVLRDIEAIIHGATGTGDEIDPRRLERILFRFDIGCEAHGKRTRHLASDHREDAENIARAYRDAGAS